MKQVNYVMRKKDNKYIIIRYIFEGDKMISKFWVNTYSDKKDVDKTFENIHQLSDVYHWRIIKDVICENIRELIYTYDS